MIIKHGRRIWGEICEVRKGVWAFFLDCAFRLMIGWAGKLRSHREIQSTCFVVHSFTTFSSISSAFSLRMEPVSHSSCLFWNVTTDLHNLSNGSLASLISWIWGNALCISHPRRSSSLLIRFLWNKKGENNEKCPQTYKLKHFHLYKPHTCLF